MLVAFLYWAFLVTEGAYPATHWVVNSEGKIQAQVGSVGEESFHSLFAYIRNVLLVYLHCLWCVVVV